MGNIFAVEVFDYLQDLMEKSACYIFRDWCKFFNEFKEISVFHEIKSHYFYGSRPLSSVEVVYLIIELDYGDNVRMLGVLMEADLIFNYICDFRRVLKDF